MRRIWMAGAALSLLLAGAASAQDAPAPSVTAFLADYAALKAQTDKPQAAAQSVRLMQVVADSAKRYKATLDSDAKAGKPPRACPVKGSKDSFEIDELADALEGLSEAQRADSFDKAFFEFMDKRHPCGTV